MRLNTTIVAMVLSIYFLILPVFVMYFTKDDKKYRLIRNLLLSSFFIMLLIGVIGEIDFNKQTIYIGFNFSNGWFNKDIIWKFPRFKLDIIINLLMLIPIGEWALIESKRRKLKTGIIYAVVCGLGIGLIVEFLQFALPVTRSVQLSDLILNTASSIIGYLYMALFYWIKMLILKIMGKHKSL